MNAKDQPNEIVELSDRIWPQVWDLVAPQIKGRGPDIQGGVLADLVARLLAGFTVPGEPLATEQLREQLLDVHIRYVRLLIPANAGSLGTRDHAR